MVVFKITNNKTNKHYIGTSFNSGFQRFEQYVGASNEGLDFPLYDEIREFGADSFSVEELYETEDKEELYELEQDYVSIYNGVSLRGYKIGQSAAKPTLASFGKKAMFDANGVSTTAPAKKATRKSAVKKTIELPKEQPKPTSKSFFGELIGEERLDVPAKKAVRKKADPSTTRPKSKAAIQKLLREAEKKSKLEREEQLKSAQQEQADEMAQIMAKIDVTAKMSTSAVRRRKD
ncbi:GIY-YIG nuclease family protein [Marinomonas sp. 2405UD68-3]|uniref:GIY-YIG nuclease family protein n=1 Tax=Marinomonas sp. 2405UD68-3 TaxID=3391835 RepID=UPI0039C95858